MPTNKKKTKAKELLNVQTLEEAFVRCRTLGHSWLVETVGSNNGGSSKLITLRCTSCRAHRMDSVSIAGPRRGTLLDRRYAYVEGYTQKAFRAPARQVFRYELVRRFIDS